MKKILIATPIFVLMCLFAGIQWFRLQDGGHAFTATDAQLVMWSLSHIAIMCLTGICIVGMAITHGAQKVAFGAAVAFCAAVQIAGAYVGLSGGAAQSDATGTALLRKAEAMERQAGDIRASTTPIIIGLSETASTSAGRASRDRLDATRGELQKAGELETAAADLRAQAGVTSSQVAGSLSDILILAMTLAIELGFAVCAHLLAHLFCNEFASVFNGLRRVQKEQKPGK